MTSMVPFVVPSIFYFYEVGWGRAGTHFYYAGGNLHWPNDKSRRRPRPLKHRLSPTMTIRAVGGAETNYN